MTTLYGARKWIQARIFVVFRLEKCHDMLNLRHAVAHTIGSLSQKFPNSKNKFNLRFSKSRLSTATEKSNLMEFACFR